MRKSKIQTATNVALGLVLLLLPEPHRLGDAQLFSHGRLHLWPKWRDLRRDHESLVDRFIRARPESLVELPILQRAIASCLDSRADFLAEAGDRFWERSFRLVSGRPVEERIQSWLRSLEKTAKRRCRSAPSGASVPVLALRGDNHSYLIPRRHLGSLQPLKLAICTADATPSTPLEEGRLLELARRIDSTKHSSIPYEKVAIEGFLRNLKANGKQVTSIGSGTGLVVAPTGRGKSVFARLLAIDQAIQGKRTTMVVPTIGDAWKEALRIERTAEAIGAELRTTTVSSWRGIPRNLAAHLERPPKVDPDGMWAIKHIGYACRLNAYHSGPSKPPSPGQEPCNRLRVADDKSEKPHMCPYALECGRFSGFKGAESASILIANHHAFLSARVPIPTSVDGGALEAISVSELALRTSHLVIIDEIDGFQQLVIGANSRSLVLSSSGSLSLIYNLLNAGESFRVSESRAAGRLRFDMSRSALLNIIKVAERFSELCDAGYTQWPFRGKMTWREGVDGWLAGKLFPGSGDALDQVRALYQENKLPEEHTEALRVALRYVSGVEENVNLQIDDVLIKIATALENWVAIRTETSSVRHIRQKTKKRIIDRLVLRAVLNQLDSELRRLRSELPKLDALGVPFAGELLDRLLGYAPWSPSPTGPLDRRLFGYTFSDGENSLGTLETRALGGDPHGFVAEMGGLVSRATTGHSRTVLGFSATCRFRGSPKADIDAPVVGALTDDDRNVNVIGAEVDIRISGVSDPVERLNATGRASRQLWPTLASYLDRKLGGTIEEQARARALIVTLSYAEAERVAYELSATAARTQSTIRYLVPKAEDAYNKPNALPLARVEEFGSIRAPAVLVGPLVTLARGHNIVQREGNGIGKSAISGIFVMTRPIPPASEAKRFLAHISYKSRLAPVEWRGSAYTSIQSERRRARGLIRNLQRNQGTFRQMNPELRREVVCDMLVDLAQLAGRARRGRTPVDLVFVDAAFRDELAAWKELVHDVLQWWSDNAWLPEMVNLHGAYIHGLARYAGFPIKKENF